MQLSAKAVLERTDQCDHETNIQIKLVQRMSNIFQIDCVSIQRLMKNVSTCKNIYTDLVKYGPHGSCYVFSYSNPIKDFFTLFTFGAGRNVRKYTGCETSFHIRV